MSNQIPGYAWSVSTTSKSEGSSVDGYHDTGPIAVTSTVNLDNIAGRSVIITGG
jgi:hypothetical protein